MGDWDTLCARLGIVGSRAEWSTQAAVPPKELCGASVDELARFMETLGPGTLGEFLHLPPPAYANTIEQRIGTLMSDADRAEFLSEIGSLVVVAHTDNGDMCCVDPSQSTPTTRSPVLRVPARAFEASVVAPGILEFLWALVRGEDLFGIGALPARYAHSAPYGPLS